MRLDGLDIVVCTAGVLFPAPFLDQTLSEWDQTFAVNARGAFLVAQRSARHMIERGTAAASFSTRRSSERASSGVIMWPTARRRPPSPMQFGRWRSSSVPTTSRSMRSHPAPTETEMLVGRRPRGDIESVIRGDASHGGSASRSAALRSPRIRASRPRPRVGCRAPHHGAGNRSRRWSEHRLGATNGRSGSGEKRPSHRPPDAAAEPAGQDALARRLGVASRCVDDPRRHAQDRRPASAGTRAR